MPDLATISAALTSLKAATDIAKFLRESDLSLEKAELKLKLADLISALADTKIELVEVQELLIEKDKMIAELKEAFEIKDTLIRPQHLDAYYITDAEGNPIGIPYCLKCWQNNKKKRQLVQLAGTINTKVCTTCGQKYQYHNTPYLERTKT